jgi:hypothetical protein
MLSLKMPLAVMILVSGAPLKEEELVSVKLYRVAPGPTVPSPHKNVRAESGMLKGFGVESASYWRGVGTGVSA